MEHLITKLVSDFERGRMTRRQFVESLAVIAASAPSASGAAVEVAAFKAIAVNHISYGVADYARTRDFYAGLFGMQVRGDNGKQCSLGFGDSFIVVRHTEQPGGQPYVDHFAITIDNWNGAAVETELKRRGLDPRPDGETSFLIKDPDGFELQISAGRRPRA
jgi:catechol 2,3-dioxygenase-like lactoylglutathione lyase family enzyme